MYLASIFLWHFVQLVLPQPVAIAGHYLSVLSMSVVLPWGFYEWDFYNLAFIEGQVLPFKYSRNVLNNVSNVPDLLNAFFVFHTASARDIIHCVCREIGGSLYGRWSDIGSVCRPNHNNVALKRHRTANGRPLTCSLSLRVRPPMQDGTFQNPLGLTTARADSSLRKGLQ